MSSKSGQLHYDAFYSQGDFRRFPKSERAFIRALIRRFDLQEGMSVLDVGCGTGKYAKLFVECGFRVTGIDISTVAIDRARSDVQDAEFLMGDIRTLPLPAEGFDVVFASGVSLFNVSPLGEVVPFARYLTSLVGPGGTLVFVKTSALSDKTSPRGSRIDYSLASFREVFTSSGGLRILGAHTLYPHVFPILGVRAFSAVVSSVCATAATLTGIPVRVSIVMRRTGAETAAPGQS